MPSKNYPKYPPGGVILKSACRCLKIGFEQIVISSKFYSSSRLGIKRDFLVTESWSVKNSKGNKYKSSLSFFYTKANEYLILVDNSIHRKTKQALLRRQLCFRFSLCQPKFSHPLLNNSLDIYTIKLNSAPLQYNFIC